MKRAAEAILLLGPGAVLVKGGHRKFSGDALDVLFDQQGIFTEFRSEYLEVGEIHGSGCTLSAAIAANLGSEMNLDQAVASAKKYVTDLIRGLKAAPRIGHGAAPL